jgi:uncharacterized protein (TIGR04255 family)
MVRKVYKNPPIDEATCQFSLAEPLTWDPVIPGRLFERLRARYPGMPSQQQLVQANLTPAEGLPSPNLAIVQQDRVVFVDEAGTSRLSVGPNTISVHRTRPYVGFLEELLPRIRVDLPEVVEILDVDPVFSQVSTRYLNRIVIDAGSFDLSEYFTYWAAVNALPEPFEGNVTGLFYRTAGARAGHPQTLTLTFASLDAPKGSSAFLLDIDLAHQFNVQLSAENAIDQLVELKTFENEIFESLITDKCRDLFK